MKLVAEIAVLALIFSDKRKKNSHFWQYVATKHTQLLPPFNFKNIFTTLFLFFSVQ